MTLLQVFNQLQKSGIKWDTIWNANCIRVEPVHQGKPYIYLTFSQVEEMGNEELGLFITQLKLDEFWGQ